MALAAKKTEAVLWCGIVLPEHVHLLVSAQRGKSPLDMAACFKRLTTIAFRRLGFIEPLWQRRIHDRGLRADFNNDIELAVRYLLDNPVRRSLVLSWEDWPFCHIHQDIAAGTGPAATSADSTSGLKYPVME